MNYSLAKAKKEIDDWYKHRGVPKAKKGKLLLASWNVANLGDQKRSAKDLKLVAHVMKRFELIAVQEIKTNYKHFATVVEEMGPKFDWIMNDPAGNSERLGFIYRKDKVTPGRLFGEIAYPAKDFPKLNVVVPYRKGGKDRVEVYYQLRFTPFDRSPFVATFSAGEFHCTLASVHLYFGAFRNSTSQMERAKYARRVLEIYALGKWAKKRAKSKSTYDPNIILLGDMNVPHMEAGDSAFEALKASGLKPLKNHGKTGGSNLGGTKTYDQMAITPGAIQDRMLDFDVFDFDNGLFRTKWDELSQNLSNKKAVIKFNSYVRFHVSDHRPIWMQLDIT